MKNPIRICVPSKNRTNYTIGKVFPEHTLFVEPQDKEKYEKERPEQKDLVVISENDKGFGFVNNEMAKYVLSRGERYYLFTDDDIYGLKIRCEGGKMRRLTVDELNCFLSEGRRIMEDYGLSQLGVSFMGHNWYEKGTLKFFAGCWGMVFMDAVAVREVDWYETKTKLFNDYEISARFMKKKMMNAMWYKYAFEHKMDSAKGGASELYKKNKLLETYCLYMKAKYGKNCKMIISKAGKKEVRFNWKALFNE